MGLTQKQENFCQAVIELGDYSKAYRAAYGGSKMKPATVNRRAKELADNGKIQARIAELTAPALAKAEVTVEYIVNNLVEIVERCLQRAPVRDMKGRQIQDELGRDVWRFDSKGANSALATLAKYKGMLTDKIQMDVTLSPATILEKLRERRNE